MQVSLRRGFGFQVVFMLSVCVATLSMAESKNPLDFEPTEPIPGDEELLKRQAPLLDAADSLEGVAKAKPGFASIEIDIQNSTVKLFWKASVAIPSEVKSKIKELNSSQTMIKTSLSPFSRTDLLKAKAVLLEGVLGEGIEFRSIGPAPSGRGLRVEVPSENQTRLWTSDAYAKTIDYLSALAAFPTENVLSVSAGPQWWLAALREDDGPLFWGGARIRTNMGRCSVAFAAGNLSGKYLLSAGHCFDTDGVAVETGGSTLHLGPSARVDAPGGNGVSLDLGRIDMDLDEVNGWVWNRGLGQQAAAAPVQGTGSNFVGMLICTSGSFSGERCDGQVESVDQLQLSFGPNASGLVDELVFATQLSGSNLGGTGDSGGPVYSFRIDLRHIRARGILSAESLLDAASGIDFRVPCTGDISPGRICSRRLAYSTIQNSMIHHDVWIEDGVGP